MVLSGADSDSFLGTSVRHRHFRRIGTWDSGFGRNERSFPLKDLCSSFIYYVPCFASVISCYRAVQYNNLSAYSLCSCSRHRSIMQPAPSRMSFCFVLLNFLTQSLTLLSSSNVSLPFRYFLPKRKELLIAMRTSSTTARKLLLPSPTTYLKSTCGTDSGRFFQLNGPCSSQLFLSLTAADIAQTM